MKTLLPLLAVLIFASSVWAITPPLVRNEYTVEWRMLVHSVEQEAKGLRIQDHVFTLRPLPKAKPKDPPSAALFWGDANRLNALVYPGKWYHFTVVARAGRMQLYVNGFPDGEEVPASSGGVTWDRANVSDVKITRYTMPPEEVLASFKAHLTKRTIVTVAHRGVHKHAPENTRISYVQAVEAGAPIVEFDTALTADGHIVGMHDKTVDRTTDGTGKIAELTLEQVRKLEAGSWKHPKYKGEPVPTLDEIAEVVRGKAILMLDLKAEGQGAAIAKWLEATNYPHDQLILAPWEDQEGVALRKHVPPSVPMIRLTSKLPAETIDDGYFQRMKSIGFSGFSVNWQHLTEAFTRAAQKHGMKVYVWTLNEPPDIAGAALLGVDGVITDDSAATIKLLAELVRK